MSTILAVGCLSFLATVTLCAVVRMNHKEICGEDPDMCRNVSQLVTSKGYPCEEYTLQTKDGFLLTIQRIPHGRSGDSHQRINQPSPKPRPVVFLQHGLLCSSSNWVTNLANESLAYLLADAGFDVWLGNVRGNTYSRKHVSLKPSQAEFWAWSFDEMAKYDLPAMVSHALQVSKQKQLYYVGHSQGTLMAFTQLSHDKDLASKVKKVVALAPVAYVKHIDGALKYFTYISDHVKELFDILGVHEFMPNDKLLKFLAATLCDTAPIRDLCTDVLFLMAGFDVRNFNQTRLPVYLTHTPAGTSTRNIIHFAQMVKSGKFQMYNYGKAGNLKHYGQPVPPIYNATNVHTDVIAFTAGKDWLADPEDVLRLISELPNVDHVIDIPEWNHLDFIWGLDAPAKIYHKIIQLLQQDQRSILSANEVS